jgi:hypothetical protein
MVPAETKEQLAGFYLIDAKDLNEAIQLASKIPPAGWGAWKYVRSGNSARGRSEFARTSITDPQAAIYPPKEIGTCDSWL